MDLEHRLGLLGIGAAAIALVVTQTDLLPLNFADLNPFKDGEKTETAKFDSSGREIVFERDFDFEPGGQLSIDVSDADVSVRAGRGNEAAIRVYMSAEDRYWGREVFRSMGFEADMRGGGLQIGADDPDIDRSHRRGNDGNVGFLVEVTVPSSCDATISTGDGDIVIGDLEGEINLETSDGDIAVGALAGSLYLRTSDGDVSASKLEGDEISVRTSDGDVSIGVVLGAADISTSDGDISVEIDRMGDLSLRTSDGDITIIADASVQADVDFSGESVDLGSGFTLSAGRVSTHGAQGVLNGGGPKLRAHTGDGTIMMRRRGEGR